MRLNDKTILLGLVLGVAAAAGCYTGTSVDPNASAGTPRSSLDGTDPAATPADAGGASDPAATGLPCDVADLFANSCGGCHGDPLRNGAPNRLVSYEDLAAPSDDDPSKTVAELSLERMQSAKRPMPPSGALSADRIAVLEGWVKAGLPRGTCGTTKGGDDGGAPEGGRPKDAGADASSVCTSGATWSSADGFSAEMHPGKACIACHSANAGPSYVLAGTVYPTMHEPDDCLGKSGVSVVIVDAAGVTHTIAVNDSGNFTRVTSIPLPYRAMVVSPNGVKEMKTPQTDGDCNGCHTEFGNGAPGRVTAP